MKHDEGQNRGKRNRHPSEHEINEKRPVDEERGWQPIQGQSSTEIENGKMEQIKTERDLAEKMNRCGP
jgi:hypothetical protein